MWKDYIKKPNYKPLVSLVSILILWEIAVLLFKFPTYILPSPIEVFIAIFKYYNVIFTAMLMTMYEALVGYAMSIVIGLPLGVYIVYSKFAKEYIMPLLVMTNSVPKSALAPIFLLWA